MKLRWKIVLIILPVVTAVLALGIGRYFISPVEVMEALAGRFTGNYEISEMAYKTVWNLRIPRILLALLVGAGLSTAGCAFQSLFANPLATPDTLGVASGASFGAALGILFGFDLLGMQLISFLMGGILFVKGKDNKLIKDWLDISLNHPEIILDPDLDRLDEEYDFFAQHKHDQPVLTALAYKYKDRAIIMRERFEDPEYLGAISASRVRARTYQDYLKLRFKAAIRELMGEKLLNFFRRK